MPYSTSDFDQDVVKAARTLHLSYRRAQFVVDRWFSGFNVGADNDTTNLVVRCTEIIADFEANGNAKLNTVLAKSDLQLPGDAE